MTRLTPRLTTKFMKRHRVTVRLTFRHFFKSLKIQKLPDHKRCGGEQKKRMLKWRYFSRCCWKLRARIWPRCYRKTRRLAMENESSAKMYRIENKCLTCQVSKALRKKTCGWSHDVYEKKGQIEWQKGWSHDLYENKQDKAVNPTMLMKRKGVKRELGRNPRLWRGPGNTWKSLPFWFWFHEGATLFLRLRSEKVAPDGATESQDAGV